MPVYLSENVIRTLKQQLKAIEQRRKEMPQYGENDQLGVFFGYYEPRVHQLLKFAEQVDTDDSAMPFVTIGCEVQVSDLDNGEIIIYRIVDPAIFELEGYDITFLSPLGKALLFQEAGSRVDISVPDGVIRYLIQSIRLDTKVQLTI